MKIIYRISDAGYSKIKPEYINNENCLSNAVKVFDSNNFTVIADNVSDETYNMICKYVKSSNIVKVSEGSGAQTFNLALNEALNKLNDDEIVYFIENDYLHRPGSKEVIKEGIELGASFVTLYDHPDKYLDPNRGGNKYCQGGAEDTRVYLTQSSHWKITNSTTMTFAAKVKTLREVEPILRKHTTGTYPRDFDMFLELRENNRILISSIPGYSTHGETAWLTPLIDWSKI